MRREWGNGGKRRELEEQYGPRRQSMSPIVDDNDTDSSSEDDDAPVPPFPPPIPQLWQIPTPVSPVIPRHELCNNMPSPTLTSKGPARYVVQQSLRQTLPPPPPLPLPQPGPASPAMIKQTPLNAEFPPTPHPAPAPAPTPGHPTSPQISHLPSPAAVRAPVEEMCGICISPYENTTLNKPCNHAFCFECIQNWVLSKIGANGGRLVDLDGNHVVTCPTCRADIDEMARIGGESYRVAADGVEGWLRREMSGTAQAGHAAIGMATLAGVQVPARGFGIPPPLPWGFAYRHPQGHGQVYYLVWQGRMPPMSYGGVSPRY